MTTRIPASSARKGSSEEHVVVEPAVTVDVVDQAVEETLREHAVDESTAAVVRRLMSADPGTAVAHAYYHGLAAAGLQSQHVASRRARQRITYALTDKQVAMLGSYAPDFKLEFVMRDSHDHPMAAACRQIDRAIVHSRIPPGMFVSDVGGSPTVHIDAGTLGVTVHACAPIVDAKDPARSVLVGMRARKAAGDPSRTREVRAAAQAYLQRDRRAVCGKLAQECMVRSSVITSVHVYDVPMADWPTIMENKHAVVVEGCMLHPEGIFQSRVGEMTVAGARYEVDVGANRFRMGMLDSPAWWYDHDFTEYLKYGVDQVMRTPSGTYSYKLVERRGDTIFFRILRVAGTALPEYKQCFRVPGVPMVRVNGFPITRTASPWSTGRRTYLFPQPLWEDMLAKAKDMLSRGALSHERLYNYYRTVAPRQTINSVRVAGGYNVADMTELAPLIVHVALFAAADVWKAQVETGVLISAEMRAREASAEWTAYKVLAAFGEALKASLKLVCAPLLAMGELVRRAGDRLNVLRSLDWEVVAAVQVVSAKLVLSDLFATCEDIAAEPEVLDHLAAAAPEDPISAAEADPALAAWVLELCGPELQQDRRMRLQRLVDEAKAAEDPGKSAGVMSAVRTLGPAPVVESASATVVESDAGDTECRAAVEEAIVECEMEARKVEGSCAARYRDLVAGGSPSRQKLLSHREAFNNPDFWWVEKGVLQHSFSGSSTQGFVHSAVYVPQVVDGSRLAPVREEEYKGMSMGEYVERLYCKLPDDSFTGWAYTDDSLLIHNGPDIAAALRESLKYAMDFKVVMHQGPPGCGKTTQIVGSARLTDMVLVPVRKAARETAGRLVAHDPRFSTVVKSRVRTTDSYLANCLKWKAVRDLRTQRLLADEGFMTRAGRWYAAAALLRAGEIHAYGDVKQIPHVPRAECPKLHLRIASREEDESFVTYRCPPQSVACWGGVYDWKVRSVSQVRGEVSHVSSVAGREIPSGCVMMGMYQADKRVLQDKYKGAPVPVHIMTVHESQGNTYEHVWLHRFDLRRRSDKFSLYDREEYVLVAMSRNTRSFVYVAPDLGDVVSKWIKLGKDPRRQAAAQDIKSAGESKEFG